MLLPDNERRKFKVPKGSTYGDAIAMAQAYAAINGDTSAAREIREAIEGKATARHEITGEDGCPVKVDHGELMRKMREIYGLNYPPKTKTRKHETQRQTKEPRF